MYYLKKLRFVFLLLLLAATESYAQVDLSQEYVRVLAKITPKRCALTNPQLVQIADCEKWLKDPLNCGSFFELKEVGGVEVKGVVYVGRVFTCGETCGSENMVAGAGGEYFDYAIFYDLAGKVERTQVLSYDATRGEEVCAKSWLKQFVGHRAESELRVGREVDAISGATKSVHSMVNDLALRSRQVQLIINGLL